MQLLINHRPYRWGRTANTCCLIVPRLLRKRGTLKIICLSLCHKNFNLPHIFQCSRIFIIFHSPTGEWEVRCYSPRQFYHSPRKKMSWNMLCVPVHASHNLWFLYLRITCPCISNQWHYLYQEAIDLLSVYEFLLLCAMGTHCSTSRYPVYICIYFFLKDFSCFYLVIS